MRHVDQERTAPADHKPQETRAALPNYIHHSLYLKHHDAVLFDEEEKLTTETGPFILDKEEDKPIEIATLINAKCSRD